MECAKNKIFTFTSLNRKSFNAPIAENLDNEQQQRTLKWTIRSKSDFIPAATIHSKPKFIPAAAIRSNKADFFPAQVRSNF